MRPDRPAATCGYNFPPRSRWRLRLAPDLYLCSPRRPDAFRRLWLWLLLGWTWERIP